jgi:hypothetical protein
MFKYLSRDGAAATLQNRTVQLSAPAAFNDPFDAHIADPLGLDPAEFVRQLQVDFLEFISGDLDYAKLRPGRKSDEIITMHRALAAATAEQREAFLKDSLAGDATNLYDVEDLERISAELAKTISDKFSRYGIFCASRQPNVLLMWSHYAEQYKGFVFEITPNVEKDSAFQRVEQVVYTGVRPLMYRTPRDMIFKSFMLTLEEATRQIVHSIIYSKAEPWSYEEEVRLYIPEFMGSGEVNAYLNLHPEELTAVFVGCRTPADDRRKVVELARATNPNIRVFDVVMDRREYRLNFVPDE